MMTLLKRNMAVVGLLLLLAAGTGFAVWPPSTSGESVAGSSSTDNAEKAAFRRSHTADERLENDTRRLEEVLNDLKEDAQALHKSSGTKGPEKINVGSEKTERPL